MDSEGCIAEQSRSNRRTAMEEHFKYLDELRESGRVNMHGAAPWLMREFPGLTKAEATAVLKDWMARKIAERHE
jgi:hypothetical protein